MATKIAEAYIEVRTNQTKFSKELKGMERTVKSSTDRMKKNFDRIGKGVSVMSRAARLGFIAVTAAIAGTVYAAAKYEKQMATVSTMLSRKSMPIMKKYGDLVGKMGIIFGESTETLSKGLYDILSASIKPEKALKVLAVSAKAAAAGLTDTGVAADAITTIINSYGYAAEDAGMISDKLFTIIKEGKTTFAELGPNIGKVAATAAMAGLSFDELGATIATVTKAGIRTEMAMTAINGVMKVFIKPTDEAKEAAREFGVELDTNTLQTIGLVGVLEKLNGATAEQLALIFPEIEGLKGIAAALQDLTGHTEVYKAMLESAGATQEAYLKQTNTLTFTFNQLKEAGKYLAVQVGEIFTPLVSQAIKRITDLVIKMGQAIKGLTTDQKNSIAQMVLFGAAVLAAIGSLSLFSVVARLVVAAGGIIAGTLGLVFTPLGLLIVGIGALVLAWTLGWKKIKDITSKLVEIAIMPTIKFVGKKVEDLADWIQEKLGIPEEARMGIWKLTDITTLIDFIADLTWKGIQSAGKVITDIVEWIKENAKIEKIDQLAVDVEKFFVNLPDPVKWMFRIGTRVAEYAALGYLIWSALNAVISKLKIPVLSPIRAAINIVLVIGTFKLAWDVGKWIQDNIKPIGDFIQKEVDKFQQKHPLLWEQFITAPVVSVAGIKTIALFISEMIASAIDKGFEAATEYIGKLADEFWSDFVGGMVWSLKKIWEGIKWEWMKFENLIEALKQAWRDIDWSWFGFDDVKDFFKDIWEKFDWSWLNWENFVTALQEAWDNTDFGWFGNSIKWMMGLFKKDIEEMETVLEIDWSGIWGDEADAQTRKAIDNISELRKTVEKEIGGKIPKEFDKLIVALVASESKFDKSATNMGGAAVGLGQITQGALDDINKDLKKAGSKWEFTLEDMQDPVKNLQATILYFMIVSKRNDRDLMKSVMYWKGWGDEIKKSGGKLKEMKPEAQKQFKAFLKICEEFGIDAVDLMTLIGKKMVGGSGGIIGELEDGQVQLENQLNQMTSRMGKMVDGMGKIFMPIIGMFKMIFTKVIEVIKAFDEEAGTELENFINETLGAIEDMFGGMEEGAEEMSLTVRRLFRDIESSTGDALSSWQRFWESAKQYTGDSLKRMGEATADYFSQLENWLGSVLDAFTAVISGTKSFGQALLDLAYSIPVIGGIAEAIVGVVTAIWEWVTGAAAAKQAMAGMLEEITEATENLSEAFKDVGASLTGSINDAERAIRNLMQTQEELAMNTREKLIKELDNYYDYRVLKEMDLTELLELAAETRGKIETDSMEKNLEERIAHLQGLVDAETATDAEIKELAESRTTLAEENAAREKDAKVGTLRAIEDAYAKESKMIDKKIKLLEIEIKLLIAAAKAEQGKLEEADKLRKEALVDLYNLQYTEEEQFERAKKRWEERKSWWEKTRGVVDEARIGIELWGEEISKIPDRIDFDIVGDLHMPDIPRVGRQTFDIVGQYKAPTIPSYQGGIPYVPRTQIAEIHPKEAVLTAPQAEEWRAGGAGGGTKVIYERGAIRMTVMGGINQQVDLEKAMDYLARKQAREMEKV